LTSTFFNTPALVRLLLERFGGKVGRADWPQWRAA
jgi:hypothetical protein